MTKFKTSEECQLELVASTIAWDDNEYAHTVDSSWRADWLPVSAARASFGKEDKTGKDEQADRKLLHYLAVHKHVSVFEHNYATFLVECPLFVARQIMRHQSLKFNEVSRRYTSEDIAFWIPDIWRKQADKNKQCSTDEEVSGYVFHEWGKDGVPYDFCHGVDEPAEEVYKGNVAMVLNCYEAMIFAGVCREQARAVLPQSLLTRFYVSGNLRSYWSFLTARCAPDTQKETRIVAERIKEQLVALWPESMGALFNGN